MEQVIDEPEVSVDVVSAMRHLARQGASVRQLAECVQSRLGLKPDALRRLVRNFADGDVAYVCGGHFYEAADGTNREGTYWRWEAWLRRNESELGSITGGIGPIYTVRRSDYVDVDPRFGHDHGRSVPSEFHQTS